MKSNGFCRGVDSILTTPGAALGAKAEADAKNKKDTAVENFMIVTVNEHLLRIRILTAPVPSYQGIILTEEQPEIDGSLLGRQAKDTPTILARTYARKKK